MRLLWPKLLLAFCAALVAFPLQSAPLHAAEDTPAAVAVIINEIHYDPSPAANLLEFVEFYNPTGQAISLDGWALDGGIEYTFPVGAVIQPRGYLVVAVEPGTLNRSYGVSAFGPWQGRLGNDGDDIILRDSRAQEIDRVAYGVGFPWPVTGYTVERSIGLITPDADNTVPGAWRAGPPTPGRANAMLTGNPPPFVDAVAHQPVAPTSRDTVTVSAHVTDADGISTVRLWLQAVAPGSYVRLTDPAYATAWAPYVMQPAGDDSYTVTLPAALVRNRYLLRYRVEAIDRGGRSVMTPAAEDPQPNFALFVYDGVPTWNGAVNPWAPGSALAQVNTFDFARMRSLPAYHLIAANSDVADAQFIPNSNYFEGYMGSDYRWRGTLVYDGIVYDHIGFRARGQAYRYGTGKNKWKFNFLPGHRFQSRDAYGAPYPVKWDKLNLTGGMQHVNRGYRGEHGMFEALSMRVFAMAGVPAPATHFVQFRVVDESYETASTQYESDFWGLYMAVEEVDGRFLQARDLPDGNLYKMNGGTGDVQNLGFGQPADRSDLDAFMATYTWGNPGDAWWQSTFDLAGYYRFHAVLQAVHHYDVNEGKNYFYFRDPTSGKWSIWPWDTDLTWADTFAGDGNEPFRDRVLAKPLFYRDYLNSLREIRDLLFNPEQLNLLVDEVAATINTPVDGLAMVDADRAMWDYNPILTSRYVSEERTRWGKFYADVPTRDFAGMVQYMKSWAAGRAAWIDGLILTDRAMPNTPTLQYSGPAGYPADQLVFAPSAYSDPQGPATFAAIQWRAANVAWPGLPGYVAGQPNRYEMESAWTSPELTQFTSSFTLPQGVCLPGATCRVRVRMKDDSGRWSHWSAPVQFVPAAPAAAPSAALKVTEIMYNPPAWGNVTGDDLEFLELKNMGTAPIDISNWTLADGVEYRFPTATTLAPGAFVVLAEDTGRFQSRYGMAPFGQFGGRLSDGGETITVRDAFGRTVLSFAYADDNGWPSYADGAGKSLVPADTSAPGDPALAGSWRASTAIGGSPGVDDPLPVLVNEVRFDAVTLQYLAIELYNPGITAADIGGWVLSDRPLDGLAFGTQPPGGSVILASGTTVPAGGYLVLQATQLGRALRFDGGPGSLYLASSAPGGWFSGYRHGFTTIAPATGDTVGRTVLVDNSEFFTAQSSTLGAANGDPQPGAVTITRVKLLPSGAAQWIELTNRTSSAVTLYDPASPLLTWSIDSLGFRFPAGLTLRPNGRLLVSNASPAALCNAGEAPFGWVVTGAVPLGIPAQGGTLRLLAQTPGVNGQATTRLVDEIRFAGAATLALTPGASYWQRSTPDAFGLDLRQWQAAGEPLVAGDAADDGPVSLCSFDAFRDATGAMQIEWVARAFPEGAHFALWRGLDFDRSRAEMVAGDVQGAAAGDTATFTWTDDGLPAGQRPVYWLQVTTDGGATDIAMTAPRFESTVIFTPLIAR